MPDIYDLLSLGQRDPELMKAILEDEKKIREFKISSAHLEKLKKMDPELVKVIVDSIDTRISGSPVAGTNACPGTFACFDSKFRGMQDIQTSKR